MIAVHQADRLELMLRLPLEAMRDLDFPLDEQGFLQLVEAGPLLEEAANLWLLNELSLFAGDRLVPRQAPVQIRLALPADRSFDDPGSAMEHFLAPPLSRDTQIYWRQVLLDLRLIFPQVGDDRLALTARLQHLGVHTSIDLLIQDERGLERRMLLPGKVEKLLLAPGGSAVFAAFVWRGLRHLLAGYDHLLFLLCLIAPGTGLRRLIYTVTAFTLGHCVSLAAAALGAVPQQLWFPSLIETLIAISILVVALGNILVGDFPHRWLLSAIFGLVHGFGFAFSLQSDMQWSGGHLLQALVGFNLGVELGQLGLLLLSVPVLGYCRRHLARPWLLRLLLSCLAGHAAWHWMLARFDHLQAYF